MNKACYIDDNTRISYVYHGSAFKKVHCLQRRVKRGWPFGRWHTWETTAWMYDHIISGTNRFGELKDWLLWSEAKKNKKRNGFQGYKCPQ